MSFVDSLKKGLFGSEDEYDDQYIDDGPQMVNNNNGLGVGADEEDEEPAEGAPRKNKVVNIHATTQLKVVLVKPERFEDASTIADHLNNKRNRGPEPGVYQQGSFPPPGRFPLRRRLRQQRPDQARGKQHLHHHPLQRGYHGRSAGRAGEQWRVLLILPPKPCGASSPPAAMKSAI